MLKTIDSVRLATAFSYRLGQKLRVPQVGVGLVKVTEAAAACCISGIVLLVLSNATSRYMFGRPLPWTDEVVIALMVWVAAIGIVLASIRGALISCDLLTRSLPPQRLVLVRRLCALFSAGVMSFLGWLTWQYIGLFGNDVTAMLRVPKSIVYSGLLFGSLGMSTVFLLGLRR
ncbi:TRAP transporter small permease [Vreelandella olivaria]|uniref:TRAP transporter small permease n=1 Tax=Vreelandella olivaria TaxID=390919 RepID=UPI00201F3057|nr:TRAP transporter small permease subunit [Halomonas olivaria]